MRLAKIGIITRTKNRPLLLKRAIDGIAAQTLHDWQLVIVNDGGDPEPVKALIALLPAPVRMKIRCVHNAKSLGMEAASNVGLQQVDAKYAMIHDDDDSLHPEFLARTTGFLDHPPHPLMKGVITHTERIIERIHGQKVVFVRSYPYNDWLRSISLRRMLTENVFAPIAFVFDRAACVDVGAFREDLPVLGDWDFNVRFLSHYEIGVIPEKLAFYHDREQHGDEHYASSVSAKAHLHAFYDNFLRNEWLRKDIAAGRTGMGEIANQSVMLWDLAWDIKQELQKKRPIKLFARK